MNRIVVLGAAESGVGAAALAKVKGYDVFVSDSGMIKPHYKDILGQYGVEWEEGHHTEEKILNATEVVKSPGIPENAPMVEKVRQAGIPIISEIEFAGRYTHARMICVTGSNGKTTTTSLIYHIFQEAGYNVGLAGNIGRSLALQIAEGRNFDYYIIELSSFQLDNMYKFRANIAILLNITPDHLDRYDNSMQNYADAKMRIVQNQTEDDAFVYWADDPVIKKIDGEWHQVDVFEFEDNIPFGHGEKSVYMIQPFMRITREEAFAIRYHMGFSGSDPVNNVGKAFELFPLAFALSTADMEATYFLDKQV